MKKNSRGFTLIEIMVTVSITGILSAIAIPLYQTYSVRAQVAEGITLSASAKEAVGDYFVNYGSWPADNVEAGLSVKEDYRGKYTEGVRVVNNVVEIKYGHEANANITGEKVTLTAFDDSGSIVWTCASEGVIETKYLPPVCR